MDLEIIMLSEISQIEKEKYHMISLICRIEGTKTTNESKTDSNIVDDFVTDRGEGSLGV